MTGLTYEVTSIAEALTKEYKHCLETHKKPPVEFLIGLKEYRVFLEECGFRRNEPKIGSADVYLNVPMRVVEGRGVAAIPPFGSVLN